MGQQLCQQDMGPIMKNSKANVQVSYGLLNVSLSIYSKVCSYCVVAKTHLNWWMLLFLFLFFLFSFHSVPSYEANWNYMKLHHLWLLYFIWFYYFLCYCLCFPDWISHEFCVECWLHGSESLHYRLPYMDI